MKKNFTLVLLTIFASTIIFAGEIPFSRGVNLTNWFQQSNAQQIHFSKYTKKDLENIKSLGCDVIRLPINMHPMTSGSPSYTVDPLLFDFLDQAVTWAEELQLHIILDNHTFDPAVSTPSNIGTVLIPVWKQMAEHFKSRSSHVYYEILNEPHGIADDVWNTVQGMVIDSIRTIDSMHTIIVGPAGWNGYNNLNAMPVYADTNLIYTFHFYDPFLFTHQGASWSTPSLEPLGGMPFPYNAARMPVFPAALAGTWVQNDFTNYSVNGTITKVQTTLDIAANFMKGRKVKLFCGEFGVYKPNCYNEDRVRWYDVVRKYLELKGITWTSWDYQDGFGLFTSGTDELFDHHLNVPLITALGLTVPPQSVFIITPDSTVIDLYSDYIGQKIAPANSSGGTIDLYSMSEPFSGKYCIRWTNAAQYQHVGFNFVPNKDLSLLVGNNYMLSFRIKNSSPGVSFDVRFIDTKTGLTDHPWRIRSTITDLTVPWDGAWHEILIPLKNMTEHGSWDSIWYNPIGAFDWKAIDRFEIVAEHSNLLGKELWLDDIRITVPPTVVADGAAGIPTQFHLAQNFPNPFNPSTTIRFDVPHQSHVTIKIYSILGQLVETLVDGTIEAGTNRTQWKTTVSGGVYLCRMTSGSYTQTQKLLLLK
ncbi:MAG: cellulase family glycosylhydrolase [Bacteriovoracaceae bacterium]